MPPFLNPYNWDATTFNIISALSALAAASFAAFPIFQYWQQWRVQRILERAFGSTFFTHEEINRSTQCYIEADCSNVDPTREAEIRNVIATREPVFKHIDRFLQEHSGHKHLLILADSGMGKTSALLNYYMRNQRRGRIYRIAIVPLGRPDIDEYIRQIENKAETVIFLDAFDEDTKAIDDHHARLTTLLEYCRDFRRVVMTCRTQFFHSDDEIPRITGIARVTPRKAGESGVYEFLKVYLSPFDDRQVMKYLRKIYPLWKWRKRRQAKDIVDKTPDLTARPMLLNNIPDLLSLKQVNYSSFQLYNAMVEAWIKREDRWIPNSNSLRSFSELMAVDIYCNRSIRGGEFVPLHELNRLATTWKIPLESWQLSGRSLLNRDAVGNYKFAHRSIMEFLFVYHHVSGKDSWPLTELTDQMLQFLVTIFQTKDINHLTESSKFALNMRCANLKQINLEKSVLHQTDFTAANLNNAKLNGSLLTDVNLSGTNLHEANLASSKFVRVNLSEADLRGADLSETVFHEVNLANAIYDKFTKWPNGFNQTTCGAIGPNANLKNATLRKIDLIGIDLSGCDLRKFNLNSLNISLADLSNTDLRGANLFGANLSKTNLRDAKLTNAKLANAIYDSQTVWPNDYDFQKSGAFGPEAQLRDVIVVGKIDLSEVDLRRANLCGADLSSASLTNTNLDNAIFDNLTLWPNGFDFQECGAIGPRANLRNKNLNKVNWAGLNLSMADIRGANLSETVIQGVVLTNAIYDKSTKWPSDSNYQKCGAIGPSAVLKSADLRLAILRDVDLSDADLTEANLCGVDLSGAQLTKTNLLNAIYDGTTKWPNNFNYQQCGAVGPKALLKNVDLRLAKLQGVDLSSADLTGANLCGVDLSTTNLTNTNLAKSTYDKLTKWSKRFEYSKQGALGPNAILNGVSLRSRRLDGLDISNADLSDADLSGASLNGTILTGTNLSRAKLNGASLRGANLKGSNLQTADISKGYKVDGKLEYQAKCILDGAIYDAKTKWPASFDPKLAGAIMEESNST